MSLGFEPHFSGSIQAVMGGDIDPYKVAKIRKIQEQYPDHMLYYVGDACGNMLEARRAGVQAIGVGWGWHNPARLQKVDTNRILRMPAELLDV